MTGHPRADPREFRAFCFRGAGRANFVISAERRSDGLRIVWRLAKARKKGTVTHRSISVLVNRYMEEMIAPFFDEQYLVAPKIVEFKVEDLHQLAKIPSLEPNHFVERFEDLSLIKAEDSFLPLGLVPPEVQFIPALEMLDATQIPHMSSGPTNPCSTITVEIKPKQGFFQFHPGVNLPYCNNCVLQLEKCSSSHFEDMYDFCPLDLYSGDEERTSRALRELMRNPHRNLRIFLDGNLVHANEALCDYHQLDRILFNDGKGTTEDLVIALSYVLTGSNSENFSLKGKSVLGQILHGQQQDPLGIVRAHQIYKTLPHNVQSELSDKTRLPVSGLHVLERDDPRSLIERYLLSATMKDCSIMVSLQRCPNESFKSPDAPCIRVPSGVCFGYSIKVVDLDPKSPKNLTNGYQRFMAGVKIIRIDAEKPAIPPCITAPR